MGMKLRTLRRGCVRVLLLFSIGFTSCGGPPDTAQTPPDRATDADKRDGPQALGQRRYQIESAIIKYTCEAEGVKGTQLMFFDKWGAREGFTRTGSKPIKTLTLSDPDWVTQIDLSGKTGTRMKARYARRSDRDIDILLAVGDKVGTEIVAGRKCDKWKIQDSTLWVWNSIPLKSQLTKDGKVVAIQTAVDVKENASIPEEKFKIPPDVKITELTKPEQILQALGYL